MKDKLTVRVEPAIKGVPARLFWSYGDHAYSTIMPSSLEQLLIVAALAYRHLGEPADFFDITVTTWASYKRKPFCVIHIDPTSWILEIGRPQANGTFDTSSVVISKGCNWYETVFAAGEAVARFNDSFNAHIQLADIQTSLRQVYESALGAYRHSMLRS
jgi:hypothetical protein